ncbi:MAG TPA: class I adenylate-forming enzyme family protein [Nitrospirota bacterium]|nr:class I adenylate-forming enzyme family protein [Nitrospirota bacterium]
MNIFDIIKRETEPFAGKAAVIQGDSSITYGQLIASAGMFAETLRRKGVSRTHRVGLLCDDGIDYIIASLAILSLSAAVTPVSPEQTADEIETVIDRIDVDYLIAEPRLRPEGYGEPLPSEGLSQKELILVKRTVRARPPSEYFRINPAFIRFSSGTTGTSKGVVLSHEAILDRTDAADKGLQITSADTVLWVLSMSYHFVVTILLFLRRGATIVLCGHRFPESLIEGITRSKGTFIYASPFHYSLLSRSGLLTKDSLRNVRMAVSTAIRLPEQVAEEFSAKFGFELTEAYGIIEVGLPFVRLGGNREKRGSVGKPLPDFEIKLDNRNENGVGEILVRGKGMLDAYYSPWQGRDDILADGWFRTGDLGRRDDDGDLFIAGREKDVINFVGMKIFAQEVEDVLNRHPHVRESLVYGAPHAVYGQLPMAKIVLRDGTEKPDINDLRKFCYQHLAQYKVPKDFEFTDRLPKTASGKLKR